MHAPSHHLKLIAGLAAVLLLAACGAKEDKKPATQSAARVNGAEITVHQINHVLTRLPGVTEETAPQARQEVLSRLIDQQLAVAQAQEKKLDRQPEVMTALEAARRDVLARAYLDHVVTAQGKPTAEEAKKYYADHPELFAKRRIYNLQQIVIEMNDAILPVLREKVATAKSIEDVAAWLKEKGVRFAGKVETRPAEQVPLELLAILHPLKDGQAAVVNNQQGIMVVRIAAAQAAPVDEATAMPRILQFLASQRSKEIVDKEMKQLRDKAKIEYLGDFTPVTEAKTPVAKPQEPAPKADGSAAGNVGKAIGGLK